MTKAELKKLIQTEIDRNETHDSWAGDGVTIRRTQFSLTTEQRTEVQEQGELHGCHTCLTVLAADKNQPWVGDHIPPTNLPDRITQSMMSPRWGGQRYLFPQCHSCSHQQSAVVRKLKGGTSLTALSFTEKKLIGVNKRFTTGTCVVSSGPKVTAPEGLAIQNIGIRKGCHTCDEKFPSATYHADHAFPQEFCTSYMEQVFLDLGLEYPDEFELRPQCPRCSGEQGGKMSKIRDEAMDYARNTLRMVVYKF